MYLEDENNEFNNVYITIDKKFDKRLRLADEEEQRMLDRYDDECGEVRCYQESQEEREQRLKRDKHKSEYEHHMRENYNKTIKRLKGE